MVGTEAAGKLSPGSLELPLESLAPSGLGPYAERLGLVGSSAPLLALGERIAAHARSAATVLIRGETGTGKELIARAIHTLSPRANRAFLPHNFASIADSLVESELFGHARGSFTGAHADRPGLFELAHEGTLFLDEIGDASASVQSRLLRVLQEGEVRRVGDGRARRVDVRVVAATHRDLAAEARAGRYRSDLYYRLHVLTLQAPALRERREDIPLLTSHLLTRVKRRDGLDVRALTREALDRLLAHDWPGNVRELEATLTRAAHLVGRDGLLGSGTLGEEIGVPRDGVLRERPETLRGRTLAYEAELIRGALDRCGGNRTRAAQSLGLTRQGLWKKLRRLRDPIAPD
ncbi:MAG TPA: sigma-54 dependent transcriptional regulator [Candidatus Eisenbacteria bacterium]|nr:sigma-54 dependent transcriptional regulator [Candidatus Eisenbacteria bacterium]